MVLQPTMDIVRRVVSRMTTYLVTRIVRDNLVRCNYAEPFQEPKYIAVLPSLVRETVAFDINHVTPQWHREG
jgi:hypothetical protein